MQTIGAILCIIAAIITLMVCWLEEKRDQQREIARRRLRQLGLD